MILNDDLEATRDEIARALEGIRDARIETLPAGTVLFRFAGTERPGTGESIPSSEWARGAWWFFESDYRKIIARYQEGSLGLGTVARAAGAVQPSWSLMNVSIKARLRHDTRVYLGRGLTQYRDALPNGMYMTLPGWADVVQVYIPNLKGKAAHALEIVRQKIVTTDRFGY